MSNCSNWIFLFSREPALLKDIQFLGGNTSEGRPLISTSLLQNLLKEVNEIEEGVGDNKIQFSESEVLVFSGRKRPYITHLFDINHYDYNDIPPIRKKPICENVIEKRFGLYEFWKQIIDSQSASKEPKPVAPSPFPQIKGRKIWECSHKNTQEHILKLCEKTTNGNSEP